MLILVLIGTFHNLLMLINFKSTCIHHCQVILSPVSNALDKFNCCLQVITFLLNYIAVYVCLTLCTKSHEFLLSVDRRLKESA